MVLFFVMVISGVIAVAANASYPVVKGREAKAELANDAKAILLPEIKRNSDLASSMKTSLATGQIPLQKFDVTAWETISKGGLPLGLEPAEITKLLDVYRLAYQANDLRTQIMDLQVGIGAALSNMGPIKQLYLDRLRTTVAELQVAFSELESPTPQ